MPVSLGIKILEEDVQSIIFTAGTTGRPKGAMRTHRHLMSDAFASAIDLKVDYEEKVLITFPMYHVACEAQYCAALTPVQYNLYQERGWLQSARGSRVHFKAKKISRIQLVPTMIHSLIQVPDVSKYDLSSLKLILYAGSSMPVELLKKALAIFPAVLPSSMVSIGESGSFLLQF